MFKGCRPASSPHSCCPHKIAVTQNHTMQLHLSHFLHQWFAKISPETWGTAGGGWRNKSLLRVSTALLSLQSGLRFARFESRCFLSYADNSSYGMLCVCVGSCYTVCSGLTNIWFCVVMRLKYLSGSITEYLGESCVFIRISFYIMKNRGIMWCSSQKHHSAFSLFVFWGFNIMFNTFGYVYTQ